MISGWSTNGSGSSDSGQQRPAPIRNRRGGLARQVMAPVTTPAISEPLAQAITRKPGVAAARPPPRRRRRSPPPCRRTAPRAPRRPGRSGTSTAGRQPCPAAAPLARRLHRRLGAALGGEQRATRPDRSTAPAARPERGVDRGGQEGDQHRTDDEDHLVQHGLPGEGGVQQRRAAQPVASTGPGRRRRPRRSPARPRPRRPG